MSDQDKPVLVTGGNGHLGYVLCKTLVERGYRARATVRDTADQNKVKRLAALGVETVFAELQNAESLRDAAKGCRAIFHTAAPNLIWSEDEVRDVIRPMIDGVRHVVEAAERAGINTVVYTSSCATVGTRAAGNRRLTEQDWHPSPSSAYLKGKISSERAITQLTRAAGIRLAVLNPTSVIGPWFYKLNPNLELYREVVEGRMPPIPRMEFHLVDVRDVALAHIHALENGAASGRFIIAGDLVNDRELRQLLKKADPTLKVTRLRAPRLGLPVIASADWLNSMVRSVPRRLTMDAVRDFVLINQRVSNARARAVLKINFRPALESIRDTIGWMVSYLKGELD